MYSKMNVILGILLIVLQSCLNNKSSVSCCSSKSATPKLLTTTSAPTLKSTSYENVNLQPVVASGSVSQVKHTKMTKIDNNGQTQTYFHSFNGLRY